MTPKQSGKKNTQAHHKGAVLQGRPKVGSSHARLIKMSTGKCPRTGLEMVKLDIT